jgi:hypothetical protein
LNEGSSRAGCVNAGFGCKYTKIRSRWANSATIRQALEQAGIVFSITNAFVHGLMEGRYNAERELSRARQAVQRTVKPHAIAAMQGLSDMPQLALECPHCRAEKIGFAPRGAVQTLPGVAQTLLFLQCEGCGQGIIAVVNNSATGISAWINGAAASPGNFAAIYPQAPAPKVPSDVPVKVTSAFLSGLENLGRKGGANAAGAMFRRAIELAAREIDKEAPAGTPLKQRIERLPDPVVTPAMKEWAQHIRLEGNDAVHGPDEPGFPG